MKKLPLKLVAALVLSLQPHIATAGVVNYTATYGDQPIVATNSLGGITFSTVTYNRLHNLGELGSPSLPIDFIKISVPYNATNFTVNARTITIDSIDLDYPLCPIQSRWTEDYTAPNDSFYQSGNVYPSQQAWVVGEGMIAGENHYVTIAIRPITYQYSAGEGNRLFISESVSLTLLYELSDVPLIHPIVRKDANLRNNGFDLACSKVINPQDVRNNAISRSSQLLLSYDPFLPIVNDSIDKPETYLIVTTPELRHSMRRLAALRMQKGLNVKVVTTDEAIHDSAAGEYDYYIFGGTLYPTYYDDAGKLRNYLRSCYYDRGTEYVLFAGNGVPNREKNGGHADMYFSELNACWLYSYYEEMEKEGELCVGRLLGSNEEQFDNYTNKLFRYELNPGNGDYSYLRRALFTEESKYNGYDQPLKEAIATICPDTTSITEDTNLNTPTGCQVLDSIGTNHYGFMSSFNQGYPSYIKVRGDDYYPYHDYEANHIWALSEVKDSNIADTETNNGLNYMNNKHYPMVYYCPIGNTMDYDCLEDYGLEVNYGQSFTMGKDYGGPVYIGMTTNSGVLQSGQPNHFEIDLFSDNLGSAISRNNGNLGQALLDAKMDIVSWFSNWREMNSCFNYFGDPAITMWTNLPQQYSGITVSRTDNAVTVLGLPGNSTIVSYHSNDGSTGKCIATSSSLTLNNISPNSSIMLYKHNTIPYIAPLVIQNTTLDQSQYVIASDVTMGKTVDSNRTSGAVTVSGDIEYEIEHTGEVRFCGGFKVEKGTKFSVKPSTYNK